MDIFRKMKCHFQTFILRMRTSENLNTLRTFVTEKRLTTYVFVLAVTIVVVLVLIILNYYTYKRTSTSLHLDLVGSPAVDKNDYSADEPVENTPAMENFTIKDVTVHITYSGTGEDEVSVRTNFEGDFAALDDGGFFITASNNIEQAESFFGNGIDRTYSTRQREHTLYHYSLDRSANTYFLLETFEGNAFERNGADVYFNFILSASYNSSVIHNEIPVTVLIGNLRGVNINSVSPIPDVQNQNGISYHSLDVTDLELMGGIEINASDRQRTYSDQFMIFFLGTILGIFISISVEILVEVVGYVDTKRRIDTQNSIH